MRFVSVFVMLCASVVMVMLGANGPKHMAILMIFWSFVLLNNVLYLSQILQRTGLGAVRKRKPLAGMILNTLSQEKITRVSIRGLRNFNPAFVIWLGLGLVYCVWVLMLSLGQPQAESAQQIIATIEVFFENNSIMPSAEIYRPLNVGLSHVVLLALPGFVFMALLSASLRSTQQEILLIFCFLFFVISCMLAAQNVAGFSHITPSSMPVIGGSYLEILGSHGIPIGDLETDFKRRLVQYGIGPSVMGGALLLMPMLICLQGFLKRRLGFVYFGLSIIVTTGLIFTDVYTQSHPSHIAVWISGFAILALLWTQTQHAGKRVYRMHLG